MTLTLTGSIKVVCDTLAQYNMWLAMYQSMPAVYTNIVGNAGTLTITCNVHEVR